MINKFKNTITRLFALFLFIPSIIIIFHAEKLYASENSDIVLINKVSRSYTKKFCNAIGFGLSKESAMNFSLTENNQVFKKRKDFYNINKDVLSEEIAKSVVDKCGYPLNLTGEKGILEFQNYYLSKDKEISDKVK